MFNINQRDNNFTFPKILLFLGSYFLITKLVSEVFIWVAKSYHLKNITLLTGYLNITISVLTLIVLLLIIYKEKLKVFKRTSMGKETFTLLRVMVFTYLMMFLPNFILMTFNNVDSSGAVTTNNQQVITKLIGSETLIPLFITSVLLAPILEELLFRAPFLFYNSKWSFLNTNWGILIKLIVSSLLFASLHNPNNWVEILSYMSSGLMLGMIVVTTNRIEYAIGAHFINNFLGFLSLLAFM